MSATPAESQPVPIPAFLATILSNHLVPPPTSNPASTSVALYGPSKPGQASTSGTAGASSTSNTSSSPSLFPTSSTAQTRLSDPNANPNATGGTSTSSNPVPPAPPPNALYLPPPALPNLEEDLVPPENFALVAPGVYRCGFPKKRNFGFMETLRLKTVLTLVLEDYPEANLEWCQSQDIQFMQFGIPGNKEPFDNIPEDVICSALVAILDVRNHPVLIHCNKGKHRTGCLIGCIRRLQSWSLTSIFDEYRRFSSPKSRAVDQQFIDLFDIAPVWEQVTRPSRSNTTSTVAAAAAAGGGTKSGSGGGGLENLPKWGMLTIPKRGLGSGGGVGSHLYANTKYDRGCVKPSLKPTERDDDRHRQQSIHLHVPDRLTNGDINGHADSDEESKDWRADTPTDAPSSSSRTETSSPLSGAVDGSMREEDRIGGGNQAMSTISTALTSLRIDSPGRKIPGDSELVRKADGDLEGLSA
ncbi:tyrosine specific protein phosphatase [Kwoniella heveanensis CBS 569]|nr:tyrosine specific protein phosphatase [Kwoniella heveanensis CBS 569]